MSGTKATSASEPVLVGQTGTDEVVTDSLIKD
jgi:hypothetical protein